MGWNACCFTVSILGKYCRWIPIHRRHLFSALNPCRSHENSLQRNIPFRKYFPNAVDWCSGDTRALYSGVLLYQRSEEHTSELQSRENLVCRLLLEKKKENAMTIS